MNFAQFARKTTKNTKTVEYIKPVQQPMSASEGEEEEKGDFTPQEEEMSDNNKGSSNLDNGNNEIQEPSDPVGIDVDAFATKNRIPISCQVDLSGHDKAVSCISIEPAGNRVLTGSYDYTVKIYDFGGMDSRQRAFKTIEAQENHFISSLSHSPSGDRFIVSTGSTQPQIYDRDGNEIIQFVRGDMYLRDLSNTKGHTMEVTGVHWHPFEKNEVLTSSLDGSLRIWDLLGNASFGKLINKSVLKIRAASGRNRLGATCCCYSPTGKKMFGGTEDGTIHLFNEKRNYGREDLIIKHDSVSGQLVNAISISLNSNYLAARYGNGMILVWSFNDFKAPLKTIDGMLNSYSMANLEFSPDSRFLCCGTSPKDNKPESKSGLYFFDVQEKDKNSPDLHIVAATGASAIFVKWHPITNQILCGLSNGLIRVLYDPSMSKKGVLLSVRKAPKRKKDESEFAGVGEIHNPLALPMYRKEPEYKRKRAELKDPYVAKIPTKPTTQGPGNRANNSFFFTQFVMKDRTIDNRRAEDPREALLRLDKEAKEDPKFTSRAYEKTQPKLMLQSETFEQEQEEFKKNQKKL